VVLSYTDFCHSLLNQFGAIDESIGLVRMMELMDAFEHLEGEEGKEKKKAKKKKKTKNAKGKEEQQYLLSDTFASVRQARRWQVNLLTVIGDHISRKAFLSKLMSLTPAQETEVQNAYLRLFEHLFAKMFVLSESTSTARSRFVFVHSHVHV
jgi:hypothetical protein